MTPHDDRDSWRFGFDDEPSDRPEPAGPVEGDALAPAEVATVECWRCGKPVEETVPVCPYCRARLVDEEPPDPRRGRSRRRGTSAPGSPVVSMIYVYTGILLVSVIIGWMTGFGFAKDVPPGVDASSHQITRMLVAEAIITVLVVVGIVWTKPPPALGPITIGRRVLAWCASVPLLILLMAMNFAYIHLVKTGLGLPDAAFEMAKRPELFAWVLLAICIQPAIVEELFFRYLALGHLRTILGTSGAVIVSGVMFGLAHINNPLGIPYLIVMGIGLGMIRVAGRSLAIPILIHFAHNAMVLWWEPWL